MINRTSFAALFASIALVPACYPSGSTPAADGGGSSMSSSSDAGGGSGTSCAQAVTCLTKCTEGDTACEDKCAAGASAEGRTKLVALAECLSRGACQDEVCARQKCGGEIEACLGDVPVDPDAGVAPQAATALPTELVGTWSSVGIESARGYTFYADGRYMLLGHYKPSGSCLAIREWKSVVEGVAAVSGSQLTLSPTKGEYESTSCGGVVTKKATSPQVRQVAWSVAGDTLTITDGTDVGNFKRD